MTPEQGIANLEKIYKNFWWEFGLGIIEAIDLIIFIICVCVISIYDTTSYWSAFGITLGICVLICVPMSYFFINNQHLFMSMPMPYKMRVKLANLNQGMYMCAGLLPIIGTPFCIWCQVAMGKLVKEVKDKVSKNEAIFANETQNPNDPFNHQAPWWQQDNKEPGQGTNK